MMGGTSRNLVLGKSTILYTENSMQDNVCSLDRITAITCVCKLLYVVLTNADDAFLSKGNRSITLFPESSYRILGPRSPLGSRQIHKFTVCYCTRIIIHNRKQILPFIVASVSCCSSSRSPQWALHRQLMLP
jgi:hypothetical protein